MLFLKVLPWLLFNPNNSICYHSSTIQYPKILFNYNWNCLQNILHHSTTCHKTSHSRNSNILLAHHCMNPTPINTYQNSPSYQSYYPKQNFTNEYRITDSNLPSYCYYTPNLVTSHPTYQHPRLMAQFYG